MVTYGTPYLWRVIATRCQALTGEFDGARASDRYKVIKNTELCRATPHVRNRKEGTLAQPREMFLQESLAGNQHPTPTACTASHLHAMSLQHLADSIPSFTKDPLPVGAFILSTPRQVVFTRAIIHPEGRKHQQLIGNDLARITTTVAKPCTDCNEVEVHAEVCTVRCRLSGVRRDYSRLA
jgi:hypothetical protein